MDVTAMDRGGGGYWLAGLDGGVFSFGNAPFHGSLPGIGVMGEVVGMAAMSDGTGYWLLGADGGVFAFGNAPFHGSLPGIGITAKAVAITAMPDGAGYWLADRDGRVYAFGEAMFHGPLPEHGIPSGIVAMAALPDASGYWLLGTDGGVSAFGDAPFHGSVSALGLTSKMADIAAMPDGSGYLLLGCDGSVHPFGAVVSHGAWPDRAPGAPAVGLALRVDEDAVLGARAADLLRGLQARISEDLEGRHDGRRSNLLFPVGGIAFPPVESPRVSIVIPVHEKSRLTMACLSSIAAAGSAVPYEVVVVDDNSADDTGAILSRVQNLKIVRNKKNLGFVRACNRALAVASGDYVVLLNNDTEVIPGWLDALVDTADSDPTVAIVGAKLLYPDGTLQEAGGIIWSDGSGMNYGRGDDPDAPMYNYLREVDYCSGACLLVRREVLDCLGGLDERYAPAYYEDADLAFAARSLAYKVVYQPKATVTHREGGSHGTDLSAGIKRFQNRNRLVFAEKWEEQLSAQYPPAGFHPLLARDARHGPRAVIVDHKVPLYDQDAGSVRMLALVSILIELGFVVTFVPGNQERPQPYTEHLQQMGVEVLYGHIELGNHLRALGRDLTLCILSRPSIACQFIGTVRAHAPWVTVVYDTVDLHFLRERRYSEILGDEGAGEASKATREIELAMVRAADITFTVTQEERQVLLHEVPDAIVEIVPTIHRDQPATMSSQNREGLLFVGSFLHDPNRDAAHRLAHDVMPILRRMLPGVCLTIAGSNPTPDIEALGASDVTVLGWVPDLDPLYARSRVFVAPLRYGAGMKGKICESLSRGLPTVTSTTGAEGIDLVDGEHVLIADDAGSFADQVVRLCTDEELWSRLAVRGRSHIVERFSPETVREQVRDIIARMGALPSSVP